MSFRSFSFRTYVFDEAEAETEDISRFTANELLDRCIFVPIFIFVFDLWRIDSFFVANIGTPCKMENDTNGN